MCFTGTSTKFLQIFKFVVRTFMQYSFTSRTIISKRNWFFALFGFLYFSLFLLLKQNQCYFFIFYSTYCMNIKAYSVVRNNIKEKDIGFLLSHSSTPFLSSTPMILIRNFGFIVNHQLVVPCPRRASGRRRAFSQIHAWYITQPNNTPLRRSPSARSSVLVKTRSFARFARTHWVHRYRASPNVVHGKRQVQ